MNQTKFIMSNGLAFSENKDMEKLRRYSLKGWHVRDFKFMGYTLEKGKSSDFIYSVDYRLLKEGEEEEYFNLFSSAGWSHVASEADIHLFRALPGTKPIYTDRDTTIEKYENLNYYMRKFSIPFILITVLVWLGAFISSNTLKSTLLVIASILSVIAIPTAWTLLATYRNKWRAEGKKGFVNLAKMIPFLLLLIVVIILFLVNGMDNTVYTLTSMVIGAIAFPTAIWIIFFLYHKVKEKRN